MRLSLSLGREIRFVDVRILIQRDLVAVLKEAGAGRS
jgi:hypothetical protein